MSLDIELKKKNYAAFTDAVTKHQLLYEKNGQLIAVGTCCLKRAWACIRGYRREDLQKIVGLVHAIFDGAFLKRLDGLFQIPTALANLNSFHKRVQLGLRDKMIIKIENFQRRSNFEKQQKEAQEGRLNQRLLAISIPSKPTFTQDESPSSENSSWSSDSPLSVSSRASTRSSSPVASGRTSPAEEWFKPDPRRPQEKEKVRKEIPQIVEVAPTRTMKVEIFEDFFTSKPHLDALQRKYPQILRGEPQKTYSWAILE